MASSTIHNMKEQIFETPSFEEWQRLAEQSIGGRDISSLQTETIEDIPLQPLYTTRPSDSKLVRPVNKNTMIAQPVEGDSAIEWLASMKDSLERGNETIYLNGSTISGWDHETLRQLAVLMTNYPIAWFNIQSNDSILDVFEIIRETERHKVSGLLVSESYSLPPGFSEVRTNGIDLEEIHMNGADSVTELAYSLAVAAERAEKSDDFEQFAKSVFFRFSVDTHFFMEISKFRAFRTLWKVFCGAYDFNATSSVPIVGVTSKRSFSAIDSHVNLLRAGNSAFSALLGGVDWLTVEPYNILTGVTSQSLRYARNMQLVLREETHANKVADPAGGSYFIENLTERLVRQSWNLFLEIIESGGTKQFLQSDVLTRLEERRKADVATGQRSMVGTNVYADPSSSSMLQKEEEIYTNRPAYLFEQLRETAQKSCVDVVIIPFGTLASYKSSVDSAVGYLATAGITAKISEPFDDGVEAAKWIMTVQPDYVILCSPKQLINKVTPEFLNNKPSQLRVDVAGNVDNEKSKEWIALGLNGFLYNGQDKIKKFNQILSFKKGGSENENA